MRESLPKDLQERYARASAQIAQIRQILAEEPLPDLESPAGARHLPGRRRFALERGQGAWGVTFEWEHSAFSDRVGMGFVDYLLKHAGESIHPLDLIARLHGEAPLQQRAAALDDAEATRRHLRELRRLRAIIESDEASAAEKEEAEEELSQAEQAAAKLRHRTVDGAVKTARTIRQAIRRVCASLAEAEAQSGRPHLVLTAFAAHLRKHLLDASQPGLAPAGHLIYEPPPGVTWT